LIYNRFVLSFENSLRNAIHVKPFTEFSEFAHRICVAALVISTHQSSGFLENDNTFTSQSSASLGNLQGSSRFIQSIYSSSSTKLQ